MIEKKLIKYVLNLNLIAKSKHSLWKQPVLKYLKIKNYKLLLYIWNRSIENTYCPMFPENNYNQ